MASKLEEFAKRFSGILSHNIDLSAYRNEEVAHKVREAGQYADAVAKLIFTPPESDGTPLPINKFRGNFALRPREMTIWAGYKGHGKSAFVSQVMNAVMVQGESVFIISPEFRPEKVLERMIYQRYAGRKISEDQLINWFEWAKDLLWLYDVQHSLTPDDVLALCRYAIDKFKVKHILIDSLMKCGIAPDDYAKQKQFVDRIQTLCHNFDTHLHLVAHARKGSSDESIPKLHDIKGASEIADLAENVLVVWRNKAKEKDQSLNGTKYANDPDAVVVVEAQRNAYGWVGAVSLMYDKDSMLFFEAGDKATVMLRTSGEALCPV